MSQTNHSLHSHGEPREPITLRTIRRMVRASQAFACLTCYDSSTAKWLERAGVHVLLVGDTAAEMVLGFERTIDMPLDVLIALTAGVKRGAPRTLVMADMPFLSYQADEADGLRNAGRFLTEGMADVVKFEVDASYAPLVGKMARAGIPVCAHIGSRPQLAGLTGGYASAGKTDREATSILRDAIELEKAGAVMLLIEAVPEEVTRRVMDATTLPLIGIGAGSACHGQVLVLQDLIGMTDKPPIFAEAIASVGPTIEAAGREWVRRVGERLVGSSSVRLTPENTPPRAKTPENRKTRRAGGTK